MNAVVRATEYAEQVYKDFLHKVVKQKVLLDRFNSQNEYGRELSDKESKDIKEQKMMDSRPIRLMCISGKGGGRTREEIEKYAKYYNVTLLDHLLSVTRGSLMLASLDWLTRHPDMEESFLLRKLYVMAAVAFMHDIDKDLCKPGRIRDEEGLVAAEVEERMKRYGIAEFLDTVQVQLSADQLLYLIDKVESQQANRCLPETLPAHDFSGTLPLYVRLADKLDGQWLEKGIDGVIDWLKKDHSCLRSEFLRQLLTNLDHSVQVIDIFDSHHLFLMDELQRQLAYASRKVAGLPPLIEIHHDGRLIMIMLADAQQMKEIKKQAIETVSLSLPFSLKLFISPRGEAYLLNAQPSHLELKNYIDKLPFEKLIPLFWIKAGDKKALEKPLNDLLGYIELPPISEKDKQQGNAKLYDSVEKLSDNAKRSLRKVARATLLLNLLLETKPKDGIPSYEEREMAFLACVPETRPAWITEMKEGHPRRLMTALWALMVAKEDKKVDRAIWGETGLLQQWLEGTNQHQGFRVFIKAEGEAIAQGVVQHFEQLLSGQRIAEQDESSPYHCLFTDQPCRTQLEDKMGLGKVGIKASAFSGRDGRPEPLDLASGCTHLSFVAIAEHSLRSEVHVNQEQSKMKLDAPTLIYSPATMGLFGGLAMRDEGAMNTLSLRKLSNFEVSPDAMTGTEHYSGRYRITRLESIPGKMKDQVNQLYWLLKATLRTGRPLHIFRGLPTSQPAFFYYDAIPRTLAELLCEEEGQEQGALRLEQIPPAILRLEIARLLLETWGYGYEVLQWYAHRSTRFKGICLAWEGLREKSRFISERLEVEYSRYFDERGQPKMSKFQEDEGVMVVLGRKAAKIQRYPKEGFRASNHEQTMVLTICLDGLKQAMKVPTPQVDRDSLIYGIADQLMQTLDRRDLVAASSHRDHQFFSESCLEVARSFVDDFWIKVMNRHFPSQGNLRILSSIYRMSFMLRGKKEEKVSEQEQEVVS